MRFVKLFPILIFLLSIFTSAQAQNQVPDGYSEKWNIVNWFEDTPEEVCLRYMASQGIWWPVLDGVTRIDELQQRCHITETRFGYDGSVTAQLFCKHPGSNFYVYGACPRADDILPSCSLRDGLPTTAGNPVSLVDGTKIQNSLDWQSPLDSRFAFPRSYRSDQTMRFSPVANGYGQAWGSPWNARIVDQGSDGLLAVRKTASQFLFTGTGQLTPYRGGHKFSLLESDPAEGNRPRLADGSGKQEFYQSTGATRLLEEVRWPDGYSITLTYNATDQLVAMSDTKGQMAQFTWDNTLNAAYSVPVITKIEVDTNYDGSTFAPELALNYTYSTPTFYIDQLILNSVSRTDIAQAQTEMVWEYGYSTDPTLGAPLKLTSLRDGRLDSNGLPFDFANWTYEKVNGRNYTGHAISSAHFGGDEAVNFAFNSNNSTTQTNAAGKDTITDFTLVAGRYRPTSVTGVATASCLGTSQSVSYTPGVGEPEGYVYERIERNGARTTYTRNARGLVLTKTEDTDGPAPRITTYTWDASLRLPLTRTTAQMQEIFTYSPSGLLLQYSQTDVLAGSPDNGKTRTWTYTYTSLPSGLQVLTSVDGPGLISDGVTDITTYTYDANGNMASETDPNGLITQYLNLNSAGQPTLVILPDTIEWAFTYDIVGRVTSATRDPSGFAQTINMTYDVTGQLLSYSNFTGKTWSFEYNEAKRLVKTSDPVGDTATYSYNALGNITNTSYSNGGNPATFYADMQYDELGRILQSTGANGQISAFSHDEEDNLATLTDPLANQSTFAYDALNRLTSTIDRAGNTTTQSFDDANQITQFTDPRSINTGFAYNGFGELVSEVSADRGTLSYTYNNRGLTSSMTDGRGVISTYEYDDGGRLLARRFPSNPSEDQTFTYDLTGGGPYNIGKLSRTRDETGLTRVRRAPNGTIKHVRTRIDGINYITRYRLNSADQRVWTEYPSKRRIYYNYNDADNLTRLRTRIQIKVNGSYPPWAVVVRNATYLPLGPLNSLRYGDNFTQTAAYDTSYRLTRLLDKKGPTTLRDVTLGYSPRDNLTSITDTLDPLRNEDYQYSARELLSQASGPWDTLGYTYDAVGNRTSKVETIGASVNTQSYSYPLTSNRLSDISEAATPVRSFTYDGAGNVISENRLGDIYTYTYNAANRMSSMSLNGVLQAEYKYNALGQQVWRKLHPSGQIIHSIFDLEGNRIAEYDYDSVAGTSSLLREYIWMDGLPVAVVEGGVVYYVRVDHIGRPVFATDATGAKVWEASYLPFGEVLATTGTPINLRFPGQWFQAESGLHQNWMRDYDPTIGRYMQADPLGLVDGASIYGYVGQNPGRYFDFFGLESGVANPGDFDIGIGDIIGGGIKIGGRFVGGVIAGILAPSEMADGTLQQDEVLSETGEVCKACPPCRPYVKDSILFRFDTGHTHYPAGDPHLNLLEVVQNPESCKCFYNRNTPFGQAVNPPARPGWIEYYGNYAPPLSP